MDEMEASVGVVTEMWLTDGAGLQEDIEMLEAETNLGMLTLYREKTIRVLVMVVLQSFNTVSYTHLTLPTIYSV